MTQFTYRYCQYIPSLRDPADRYDFAVVVASESEVVLIGFDLSAYSLAETSPLDALALQRSFDIIWQRIVAILDEQKPPSGHEALELLDNKSATNLTLSEIRKVSSDKSIGEQAVALYSKIREVLHEHTQYPTHDIEWQKGTRMEERTLVLC